MSFERSPSGSAARRAPAPDRRRFVLALAGTASLAACGGGGGGDTPAPEPAPAPEPSPPVVGPAWTGFAGNAQHTALGAVATQDLNRIAWRTPVDLQPPYAADGSLLAHYGSVLVSARNTVLVPVKTGRGGGFRVEARAGGNGVLLWQLDSDYRLPPDTNWTPGFNPALDAASRLHVPASGGRVQLRDAVDSTTGATSLRVFYGSANYAANPGACDATVFINTPLTVASDGSVFFGFVATAANPAGLASGLARIAADGAGLWVGAAAAASDAAIAKVATNSAPALSADGLTLYLAVNIAAGSGNPQRGYLLALDSRTLATKARIALQDPRTGSWARVSDDSTASPTVGPDGDVYFGVLEASFGSHNGRGWLLHFDSELGASRTPGGFGWADTASIVPTAMVPAYSGASPYLLMVKYNNYIGIGSGDGVNRVAILDPRATQTDPLSGLPILREVLSIAGPTPEAPGTAAVKEWCINTAAVDPQTQSVLVNSEDGWLYRWHLPSNRYTQRIQLTSGVGEAYTPTAIGADGAVYAVNNAILFCLGR